MKNTYILISLVLGLVACRSSEKKEEALNLSENLPKDFTDFYQRFFLDSTYQMEHILFPLQGLPDKADTTILKSNDFRWEMEDWVIHRPISSNGEFLVNIRPITETIIQESIRHASGQYGMERRFAYLDDGWYLIYYAGLNPVVVPTGSRQQ